MASSQRHPPSVAHRSLHRDEWRSGVAPPSRLVHKLEDRRIFQCSLFHRRGPLGGRAPAALALPVRFGHSLLCPMGKLPERRETYRSRSHAWEETFFFKSTAESALSR